MSRRHGEPPYTCPDIDSLIANLGRQQPFRRTVPSELQDALDNAWGDYAHTLESQLEDLRKSNEGLREWARTALEEKDEELNDLRAQVLALQQQLE